MKVYSEDSILATKLCGLYYDRSVDKFKNTFANKDKRITLSAKIYSSEHISIKCRHFDRSCPRVAQTTTIVNSLGDMINWCESVLSDIGVSTVSNSYIQCRLSTRNLLDKLVRVRSSNIWGYSMNVKSNKDKTGDVVVQFKGERGGPGDVYIYYDVPVRTYRRWQSAQSKGHYFWQYIRNYFNYSKLTGDKRGKLPNAIN